MGKADRDRWYVFRDLPCLKCGYNLRTQVGQVVHCPECGHANDLGDPEQWRPKDPKHRKQFQFEWFIHFGLIWLILVGISTFWATDTHLLPRLIFTALFLYLGYGGVNALAKAIKAEQGRPRMLARVVLGALLGSLCVNGTFLGILLGIAVLNDDYQLLVLFCLLGGGVSVLCYFALRRMFPKPLESRLLPRWARYCDAIKDRKLEIRRLFKEVDEVSGKR